MSPYLMNPTNVSVGVSQPPTALIVKPTTFAQQICQNGDAPQARGLASVLQLADPHAAADLVITARRSVWNIAGHLAGRPRHLYRRQHVKRIALLAALFLISAAASAT